jgi:hypothetical protein
MPPAFSPGGSLGEAVVNTDMESKQTKEQETLMIEVDFLNKFTNLQAELAQLKKENSELRNIMHEQL